MRGRDAWSTREGVAMRPIILLIYIVDTCLIQTILMIAITRHHEQECNGLNSFSDRSEFVCCVD